jgi:hypothetical protein
MNTATAIRSHLAPMARHPHRFIKYLLDTPKELLRSLFFETAVVGLSQEINHGLAVFDRILCTKILKKDLFSHNVPVWTKLLGGFRDVSVDILEVGSFEGASAMFMLEYLTRSTITCIDPFFKGNAQKEDYEVIFDQNLFSYGGRVRKMVGFSETEMVKLTVEGCSFDIIYIDGSHTAEDCLNDTV